MLESLFDDALAMVNEIHGQQFRKGTKVPYIAHLLAVAALSLEANEYHGYEPKEDLAIAALFHDAIEDQGDKINLEQIRNKFGNKVHEIVRDCSDASIDREGQEKPPWRERKESYILKIATKSREALIVSCADKLHNARSIMFDLEHKGVGFWDRFNAGKEDQLWYYKSLTRAFRMAWPEHPLLSELQSIVDRMEDAISTK